MKITISVPVRVVSLANQQNGHSKARLGMKIRLKQQQRDGAEMYVAGALTQQPADFHKLPYTVKLTRYGKRQLDDDNLQAAFKNIRDGIAKALMVNDGNKRQVLWDYEDIVSKDYKYMIEIWPAGERF